MAETTLDQFKKKNSDDKFGFLFAVEINQRSVFLNHLSTKEKSQFLKDLKETSLSDDVNYKLRHRGQPPRKSASFLLNHLPPETQYEMLISLNDVAYRDLLLNNMDLNARNNFLAKISDTKKRRLFNMVSTNMRAELMNFMDCGINITLADYQLQDLLPGLPKSLHTKITKAGINHNKEIQINLENKEISILFKGLEKERVKRMLKVI